MLKMRKNLTVLATVALAASSQAAGLLIPDWSNDRVMLFDAFDGSLIKADFATNATVGSTEQMASPKSAIDTGREIWVTDQLSDAIFVFDYNGNWMKTITGAMDNMRGLALVGDEVWVTNAGSNNGAPGQAMLRFDLAGNSLGNFALNGSSFDVEVGNVEVLVSNWSSDQIERYDFAGNYLGDLTSSTVLSNPQQITRDAEGFFVSGFSGGTDSAVYRYDQFGNQTNTWAEGFGPRGNYRLGDGNILFTKGDGAFIIDPNSNTFVATGPDVSAQYIHYSPNAVPEPATMALVGLGLAAFARRKRK